MRINHTQLRLPGGMATPKSKQDTIHAVAAIRHKFLWEECPTYIGAILIEAAHFLSAVHCPKSAMDRMRKRSLHEKERQDDSRKASRETRTSILQLGKGASRAEDAGPVFAVGGFAAPQTHRSFFPVKFLTFFSDAFRE